LLSSVAVALDARVTLTRSATELRWRHESRFVPTTLSTRRACGGVTVAPAATTRSTAAPSSASASSAGSMTVPGVAVDGSSVTVPTEKPRSPRAACACASDLPVSDGTPTSALVGALSLPARSSCVNVKRRVSPAVQGPSFASVCVGS
jgi:hypothetical protein